MLNDTVLQTPVLFFRWRPEPPDWPILHVSENVAAVLGYEAAEFEQGRITWPSITCAEDLPRVESEVVAHLAAGHEHWSQEYRVRTRDGATRWFRDWNRAHYDALGKATEVRSMVLDITERKTTEESLSASERKYRLIVETAQEGIWLIDAGARTTFVNTRMAGMLGCTVDEMMGRPIFDFMDEEGRRLAERNLQRRREGVGEQHEFCFRHKDGRPVWTLIETNPLKDTLGRYEGSLAMVMDITERRKAEQNRRELEAHIQRMQKAESLGIMAGGVAHDFNNILTAVMGNLDLAQRALDPAHPIRANLQAAQQATSRATDLCRHMLAYSGGGRLETARLNLCALLARCHEQTVKQLPAHITLNLHLAADPPLVEADASQLAQAVEQLIANAVEAIGTSPGTIDLITGTVPCQRTDLITPWMPEERRAGTYAFLDVRDTGCGMSADTRQRIFDPFFSTKFTGRGLGLPSVMGIMRMHHGVVKVESAVGRGSLFRLLLPVAPAIRPPARETQSGGLSGPNGFLVVDDEAAIRTVCGQMLRMLGYTVLTANDGLEALEVYRRHRATIGCILLDLTMPRMGGEETFRELRKMDPEVRVIVTSGYSQKDISPRFANQPFSAFLQKPFNSGELRLAVQQALGTPAAP